MATETVEKDRITEQPKMPPTDKGLKCLATIAAYYQIPCDPKSLIHQFAKEGSLFTDSDIIRAAKVLELK
jgi:ABC-type bacteriocin/lantibiotic exporter with double-glycine peptidase domain